jgi:glycosyltransferase involved in cell wall biosynthesis
MVVIPNGFDVERMVAPPAAVAALRAQSGFGPDTVVVGSVGRFHPAKDHESFVQAAALLARDHHDIRFLMVGRDVDARNTQLASRIRSTGYEDRFVLLGGRKDVPVCLSAMDVFCLHSRNEGFPNVIGEAMAMGVPCVATDVGDASALMRDTRFIAPKEDPPALANAIRRLLQVTPEERRRIGDAARVRIHEHFSMRRATERFEAVYRSCAATGIPIPG